MRSIARSTLVEFWKENKDAEDALKSWFAEAMSAQWKTPNQVKEQYRSASILKNSRVVFNVAGNKYRLLVAFNYAFGLAYIKFIGTHNKYDKINADTYEPNTQN